MNRHDTGSWLLLLLVAGVALGCAGGSRKASDASWLESWSFRRAITITNNTASSPEGYQVRLELDSSFDFARGRADAQDLRVTADDGLTLLPFWVEEWDVTARRAAIWVKLPRFAPGANTVYLYYGNLQASVPRPQETPATPVGPYLKITKDDYVRPIGDPGGGEHLLPENMVDDGTGRYWVPVAVYRAGSFCVALIYSETPTDPASWHWHGCVQPTSSAASIEGGSYAPHLLEHKGTWYLFYSDYSTYAPDTQDYTQRDRLPHIEYLTATSLGKGDPPGAIDWQGPTHGLFPAGGWEYSLVDEPFLFQRGDSWIMLYIGDADLHKVRPTEQVGFASAPSPTGPYVRFSGNPCLALQPYPWFDAGVIADPFAIEFEGTYYIGYATGASRWQPWQTGYASTTNWQDFTHLGVMLPVGPWGAWDDVAAFRGAVTRVKDAFVRTYAGRRHDGTFHIGLAAQSTSRWVRADVVNNANAVFELFAGFDHPRDKDELGNALDPAYPFDPREWSSWRIASDPVSNDQTLQPGALFRIEGGRLVMNLLANAGTAPNGQFVATTRRFGVGSLLEVRASHPNAAGDGLTAGEIGLGLGWDNMMRIFDYNDPAFFVASTTSSAHESRSPLPTALDRGLLLHRLFWARDTEVWFALGDAPWTKMTQNVPAPPLPVFFLGLTWSGPTSLEVDWVRVRKWLGEDPSLRVGEEEAAR